MRIDTALLLAVGLCDAFQAPASSARSHMWDARPPLVKLLTQCQTVRETASVGGYDEDYALFLDQKQLRSAVQACPIYQDLSKSGMERIVQACQPVSCNSTLFSKGDPGDALYFVKSGTVTLESESSILGVCREGDYFGELSLLFEAPRAATATCDNAELWMLSQADFQGVLVDLNLKGSALSLVKSDMQYASYVEKQDLFRKVEKCLIFDDLNRVELDPLVDRMTKVEIDGDVFRQGDIGDAMYLVEAGTFEFVVADGRGKEKVVGVADGDGFFGELALLFDQPRAVTVRSVGPGVLWKIEKEDFDKALEGFSLADKGMKLLQQKYEETSLLQTLRKMSLSEVVDVMKLQSRPKKKNVSLHSTLSTLVTGMFAIA